MELTLKRHDKDPYPACGFFIEGSDLVEWIAAIDGLGLAPEHIKLYGLPSRRANVLWGCLIMTTTEIPAVQLGPLASAHLANRRLIVPAKSLVIPELTGYDRERLFREDTYVLHPEFGLFKLTEPLQLSDLLVTEEVPPLNSARPADYSVASGEILAFSIASSPQEDIEQALEDEVAREKMDNNPLTFAEKMRLKFYESLLSGSGNGTSGNFKLSGDMLKGLAGKLGISGPDAFAKFMEDFKNLQERNKREVDKLLDMIEKDPESALRYAIPLDEHGYSRGESVDAFKMQDRGLNFSLFGGRSGGGGGSVTMGDEFHRLREKYLAAARKLEEEGKYEKAAYVHFKLLKNYSAAAQTLLKGNHYEKAAVVYLRYLKNEQAAAECYEQGKIYEEAIPLYTKLEKWEKVGDLNVLWGDEKSALSAYRLQLEKELAKNAYVRAAKLSKDKMRDLPRAQELLLQGWDKNIDAYECLQYYLANIPDGETAWREVQRIGSSQLNASNQTVFLKVLGTEYVKQKEFREEVRDLAYGLISELLASGKVSAHELLAFNKQNNPLKADTLRYELRKNTRL